MLLLRESPDRVSACDHAREEHHEGVHHALQQRHRHHIAVGDVRDLVSQDAFDLVLPHRSQQAGRDCDKTSALARTGREGIHLRRVVKADFRHWEVGLSRQSCDGLVQPVDLLVATAAVDQLHPGRAFRNPSRHLERDERAAHAPEQTEHRQRLDVQSVWSDAAADAENRGDDAERQDDGKVGDDEERCVYP